MNQPRGTTTGSSLHTPATPLLKVHRRQFVLGPERWAPSTDWVSIRLGALVLTHCPDLRVTPVCDAEGRAWVLLGLAIQTTPGRQEPRTEIAASKSSHVAELRHHWTGRWALIAESEVHLDAGGMIGVLIARDSAERIWCSSSPVLALAASGKSPDPDPRTLGYERGISWYSPPLSCDRGLRRLLPSELLNPSTGERNHRRLMPPIDPSKDPSSIYDELAEGLTTAMRNVPSDARPLWIGLSAGADSRIVLAAIVAAGINARAFSWVAPRTALVDRVLPPKLAELAGLEHTVLRAGPAQHDRARLVSEHAGTNLAPGDAEPLLRGVRDPLTGSSTGGQCFAVGKAKMRSLPTTIDDPDTLARMIAAASHEPGDSSATTGLRLWLEWARQTPEPNLDWRDRHYLEQRVSGWQCAKEQLYDMYTLERWPLINSGRFYAHLLSLPEATRKSGSHQMELVRSLTPTLASIPANPPASQVVGHLRATLDTLGRPSQLVRRARLRLGHAWVRLRH